MQVQPKSAFPGLLLLGTEPVLNMLLQSLTVKWDINEWLSSLGLASPSPTPYWAQCLGLWICDVAPEVAVHWIGKDLAFLAWQGERCGGHFRAELRRVHEQGGGGRGGALNRAGETVAALRSHEAELTRLHERFEALK